MLLIAGDGPLEAALKARPRASASARPSASWASCRTTRWPPLQGAADLFVLSSVLEATPTVALEALACGTPVVSTDNPGGLELRGIFGEDVAVVARQDPAALAEAILAFLDAPRRTQRADGAAHRGALPPPRRGRALPRALPRGPGAVRAIDETALDEAAGRRFRSEYDYAVFEYLRSAKVIQALERAGVRCAGRVLDAGCGGGGTAVSLAEESRLRGGPRPRRPLPRLGHAPRPREGRSRTPPSSRATAARLPFRDGGLRPRLQPLGDRARDLGRGLPARVPPRAAPGRRALPLHRALPVPGRRAPAAPARPRPAPHPLGRRAAFRAFRWLARHAPWLLQEPKEANTFIALAEEGKEKHDDLLQKVTVRRLAAWVEGAGFRAAARGPPRHRLLPPRPARPAAPRLLERTPWTRDVMIGHIQCVLVEAVTGPLEVLIPADIRFPLERANGIQIVKTAAALAARGGAHDAARAAERPAAHRRDPRPVRPARRTRASRSAGSRSVTAAGAFALPRAVFLARAARGRAAAACGAGAVVFTRDLQLADVLLRLPAVARGAVVYEAHAVEALMYRERGALYGTGEVARPRKARRLARRERTVWRARTRLRGHHRRYPRQLRRGARAADARPRA